MKRWMIVLAMLLIIIMPLCCAAENIDAIEAIPVSQGISGQTDATRWMTAIDSYISFVRLEPHGVITHRKMTYTTTHFAKMFAEKGMVFGAIGHIDFSLSQNTEFEMRGKIIAPDGTITESTQKQNPQKSGIDEHEYLNDSDSFKEVFAQMLENQNSILAGRYLYEVFFDGELVSSCNLTVIESDYTPGYTDHEAGLYDSPSCEKEICRIPYEEEVRILDINPGAGEYDDYVFEVEWNGLKGYVKHYNVLPYRDESLLRILQSEKMDDIDIEYVGTDVMIDENYSWSNMTCLTAGQAAYCAEYEEASIQSTVFYRLERAFIPKGLGCATAHVTYPNGSIESVTMEDAAAQKIQDSVYMVLRRLKQRLRMGTYTVSIQIGDGIYAEYSIYMGREGYGILRGSTRSFDIDIYTRIIAPDKTSYEFLSDRQEWITFADSSIAYDDTTLEKVFTHMMQDGGIQTGVYSVAVYIDNAMVHSTEFEVLDNEIVAAQADERINLFEGKDLKKVLSNIPAQELFTIREGECSTVKKSNGSIEQCKAIPVIYGGKEGYVDSRHIGMLTNETLPEKIRQTLTLNEREDWMNLAISPAMTSNVTMAGSATETVMTIGTAALAAENKAYNIRAYVYYSLKEERDAEFQILITKPDGTLFEKKKVDKPEYNNEGKSRFSDYSICDMLKEMKENGRILPGSYHYEIWETGSGMYMDGWFELLDVDLALGKTEKDARLYASPNKSRLIGEIPIYSNLFLYDDYRCRSAAYSSDRDGLIGEYIARVSYNGIIGYIDQRDYRVEASEGEALIERLGDETVGIIDMNLVYSQAQETGMVDMQLQEPLTYEQIQELLGAQGEASLYAEMTYTSPLKEQLMLFEFLTESPSGRQVATSQMYVYFDQPERESSENILIDAGSIVTLLERMGQQGMVEAGIYRYSVIMNGQVLAQMQFEIADQGKSAEYEITPWASDRIEDYQEKTVRIHKSGNVNVREENNSDSAWVGSALAGAEYRCLEIAENGWFRIQLEDGTIGYVSNKMAELTAE